MKETLDEITKTEKLNKDYELTVLEKGWNVKHYDRDTEHHEERLKKMN